MIHFYEIDLDRLKNTAISGIVRKTLDDRFVSDSSITLETAKYFKNKDFLELVFFANSTFGNTSYIAATDAPEAGNGQYTLVFRFYKVNAFLSKEITQETIQKVVHHCDVKMYSDAPDFYYQGAWEGFYKNDLSIYKFPGPNGTGAWDSKHAASGGLTNSEIHLTKHLAQITENIDDYLPEIVSKLKTL